MTRSKIPTAIVALCLAATACGSDNTGKDSATATDVAADTTLAPITEVGEPQATAELDEQMFPDVIDVELVADGDTWTVSATLSSPYDTPERYADSFRILAPDGTVLGERILLHDHANEQPFTRSERGVVIPDDVDTITVEGRDLEFGYGGATVTVDVPRE